MIGSNHMRNQKQAYFFQNMLKNQYTKTIRVRQIIKRLTDYSVENIQLIDQNVMGIKNKNQLLETIVEEIYQYVTLSGLIRKIDIIQIFQFVLNKLLIHIRTQQFFKSSIIHSLSSLIITGLESVGHYKSREDVQRKINEKIFLIINKNKQKQSQLSISQNREVHLPENKQSRQNLQKIQCQICLNHFKKSQFYIIDGCNHQVHLKCLSQVIREYLNSHSQIISFHQGSKQAYQQDTQTLIRCPYVQIEGQQCKSFLGLQDICAILKKTENDILITKTFDTAFQQYLTKRNIKSFETLRQELRQKDKIETQVLQATEAMKLENSEKSNANEIILFHCKTKSCPAIFQVSLQEISSQSYFQSSASNECHALQWFICPSCLNSFCLKCFQSLHPTMSCKQYSISTSRLKQDQQFQKFIKTLRKPYIQCPKCKFFVDNWRGCSTMKCRCGQRFCFKCGSTQCPYVHCLKQEKQKQEKQRIQKQKQLQMIEKNQTKHILKKYV